MKLYFLSDRFYAVFKVYRVGVVSKFQRLKFSGFFFSQQRKLRLKLRGSSLHFFPAVSIYEIHINFINDFNLINSITFYIY